MLCHSLQRLIIVFTSLTVTTSALAEKKPGLRNNQLELGGYAGVFLPSSDHELIGKVFRHRELWSVVPDLGLRVAYFPIRFVGAEAESGIMPTGTEDGTAALVWTARGHLVGQFPIGAFSPHLLVGGGVLGVASKGSAVGGDKDKALHWGLGGKYFFDTNWLARLDVRHIFTAAHGDPSVSDKTSHWEVIAGISYVLDLSVEDPDDDGITGDDDRCPKVPGIEPDGCPPKDTDKDGIIDRNDKCPKKKGPEPTGCPKPKPPDFDGDGVPDSRDKCRTDPGPGTKDGCPLKDLDKDGIVGAKDKCPEKPEDKDGFEDGDGCPDLDNDGDGVVDKQDRCPMKVGVIENRGCPDTDTDGDGVVDRLDNCPTESGNKANQGCTKKQLVVIKKEKLEILDKVFFKSGRSKIRSRSFALLNNVASVLVAHPEIDKIRVEGHTDSVGSDKTNLKLSQKRAESVMKFLVKKGVEAGRLEAKGFGEEQALETNDTKKGRAANRRVEFVILGGETTETREMKIE